jgi:prepilin-type N-terminal cleavage/methylation domain-containing protein
MIQYYLHSRSRHQGFTLVEMAMVLIILGLILGGLFIPINMQMEQRNISETRTTIKNIEEALLGYAMANGRFPCPAAAPGAGVTAIEALSTTTAAPAATIANGICNGAVDGVRSTSFDGFVPGVTLGISPTNANGYVLDAWHNPIRYSIAAISDDAANFTYIFTKTNGIKNANAACVAPCNTGMSWVSAQPQLSVCNATPTAVAGAAAVNCTAGGVAGTVSLTTNAVIVIYSLGKNWATGGVGNDEAANINGDPVFVTHEPTPTGATNGEFDDLVSWVSLNTIFNRMVQAGQLP